MFFSPAFDGFYREALAAGSARRGGQPDRFEAVCTVPVVVDDDVFVRMGHADLAARVQDLYRRGEKQAAAATIPTSLVEDVALIGPAATIRDELGRWEDTVIDTLL